MTCHSRFATSAKTAVIAFSLIAGFAAAAAHSKAACLNDLMKVCVKYSDADGKATQASINCVLGIKHRRTSCRRHQHFNLNRVPPTVRPVPIKPPDAVYPGLNSVSSTVRPAPIRPRVPRRR